MTRGCAAGSARPPTFRFPLSLPFQCASGRVGTACQPSCLYEIRVSGCGLRVAVVPRAPPAHQLPGSRSPVSAHLFLSSMFPPLHRSSAPICTFAPSTASRFPVSLPFQSASGRGATASRPFAAQRPSPCHPSVLRNLNSVILPPPFHLRTGAPLRFALLHGLLRPLVPRSR